MILDALLQLSGTVNPTTGQTLTGTGNVLSTNVIDTAGVGTGNTARDLGAGEALELAALITTTFTGGTSLQINIVQADDAALSTNLGVIVSSPVIPLASLTAGTMIPVHLDRDAPLPRRRYIGLQYVIAGTMTAGAINAAFVKNLQDSGNNTLYNSGFSVS